MDIKSFKEKAFGRWMLSLRDLSTSSLNREKETQIDRQRKREKKRERKKPWQAP
jgi:hypothetical protein